jgi:hypothetical protein
VPGSSSISATPMPVHSAALHQDCANRFTATS